MQFSCPSCNADLKVPSTAGGSPPGAKIRCPGCQGVFPLSELRAGGGAPGAPAVPPVTVTRPSPPPAQRGPEAVAVQPPLPPPVAVASEHWEAERPALEGSHSLQDLDDMARDGRLLRTDRLRHPGAVDWRVAGEMAELKTAFALRRKEVDARLRSLARKDRHRCLRHSNQAAKYVCTTCAHTFCGECSGEGRCPDCEVKMAPL